MSAIKKFLNNNILIIETFNGSIIPFNKTVNYKNFLKNQSKTINRVFGIPHNETFIINEFKHKNILSKNDNIIFRKNYMVLNFINNDISTQIIKHYGTPINEYIKPCKREICDFSNSVSYSSLSNLDNKIELKFDTNGNYSKNTSVEMLYVRLNSITNYDLDLKALKCIKKYLK